jgi:hypothetical protein
MKKLLLLLLLFTGITTNAQLQITSQANGIVNLQYGNNYSLFDPQGATEVYVYIWIDSNQTTPNLSGTYNDDWNNASGLAVLTYSAAEDKFLGQIDFNTLNFDGEGVLAQGTQIDEFNFILRNQAGDSQTGNLLASTYGYTATTTADIYDYSSEKESYFANGFFHLAQNESNQITKIKVYNLLGKELFSIKTNKSIIDLTTIKDKWIVIKVVFKNKHYFIKKFSNN